MIAKRSFIISAEQINELLIPNKLYNSRSIHKLVNQKAEVNIPQKTIIITLKYARQENIIHSDAEYDNRIIYWKK